MSTLKVNTIQDTTGNDALTIDSSGNVTASQGFVPSTQLSHRNLIINGAMQVAQRGTSFNSTSGFLYTADRWRRYFQSSTGAFSTSVDSDALVGFEKSLKLTVTTTQSTLTASEQYWVSQAVEAQNMSQLNMGTSDAVTSTLSFWVKSSVAGDYAVMFGSSGSTRQYVSMYTINSANTWEYKTITIAGETTGTWATGTSIGMNVRFSVGVGTDFHTTSEDTWLTSYKLSTNAQTNLMATSGATFQITGVQLEVGSVATPFEHRSYGEELARCQRYYQKPINNQEFQAVASRAGTGWVFFQVPTAVPMRTEPSLTLSGTVDITSEGNIGTFGTVINWGFNDVGCLLIGTGATISIASAYNGTVYCQNTVNLSFDAEL